MTVAIVVLAAGEGSRMASSLPKPLHEIGGLPLIAHALRAGLALDPDHAIVVVGHGAERVAVAARNADERVEIALQREQNGTADAVAQALPSLEGHSGDAIILYADTPLVTPGTLRAMAQARAQADVVVLGFQPGDPTGFGRLAMDGTQLRRVIEHKDASDEERSINHCNSGILMAKTSLLAELVAQVGNDNAAGERYLTDVIGIAVERGLTATAVWASEDEALGVNSRADLAAAEAAFQRRAREQALENGVTMPDPASVHFCHDTRIGRDAVIEPYVVFGPGVTVDSGARVRSFSHLEGATVSSGAVVGPHARLRPGAVLGKDAHVGNFVEVKNAVLGEGAKASHLSYIGDAAVGDGANVGAGTITCNYDGADKHRTEIGQGAFIGSDTVLVAPVSVGDGAMTAAGSVITRDVPADALAVTRAKQTTLPGAARRMPMSRRRGAAKDGESG